MFKKDYRYCEYSHYFYCLKCHTNQMSLIPSRIVLNWDFKKYPVACVCMDYLNSIADQPIICLSAVNPLIMERNESLKQLRLYRLRLSFMYDYIKVCKQCNEVIMNSYYTGYPRGCIL